MELGMPHKFSSDITLYSWCFYHLSERPSTTQFQSPHRNHILLPFCILENSFRFIQTIDQKITAQTLAMKILSLCEPIFRNTTSSMTIQLRLMEEMRRLPRGALRRCGFPAMEGTNSHGSPGQMFWFENKPGGVHARRLADEKQLSAGSSLISSFRPPRLIAEGDLYNTPKNHGVSPFRTAGPLAYSD